MEKKNKGSIIAVVVLGVLCVGMIAANIVVYTGASVEKLNQKSKSGKESAFEETEETGGYADINVAAEGFETSIVHPEPVEEETEDGQTDYICPESAERELTEEDVTALQELVIEGLPADKSIVQMVINEMYARKGYQFTDETIQAYFDTKTWYQEITERTEDMDAIFAGMTDVEKANIEFLSTYVEE